MRCPRCDTPNDQGAEWCKGCGLEFSEKEGRERAWEPAAAEKPKVSAPPKDMQAAYDEWDPARRYSNPKSVSAFVPPARYPDHLSWAISLFILCPPTAVIAILFALKTRERNKAGDATWAWRYSRITKLWCVISFVGGLALWVGLFFFILSRVHGFSPY